jgi:release factor glutamine methyltransferase
MSSNEPWTVGRLLTWTTDYLKRNNSHSARLDAEVLLARARGCQRIELYTSYGELPVEAELEQFRELVKLRARGTPVAYLVGQREFFSMSFKVTPDVLIPRPETEHLVIELLDLAKPSDAAGPLEVVDVGTGSGIIAVCAAKHLPSVHVRAIDCSAAALGVARENCQLHQVSQHVDLLEGDLLEPIAQSGSLDFVVSNPPYVSQSEYEELPADVREFEPKSALVAGEKGTEVIRRLIPQAADRLKDGGWLLMEISPMIEQQVHRLIDAAGGFLAPQTVRDLAGLPRVVKTRREVRD